MTSSLQGVCLSLVILSRRRRIHTLSMDFLLLSKRQGNAKKASQSRAHKASRATAFSSKKGDTPKAQKVSEKPKSHIPQTKIQKNTKNLCTAKIP